MQPNFDPEIDEEIHLSDYCRTLKRHKFTIFTVFFVTVTSVAVYCIKTPPLYRSTAILLIDQESSNVVTISENNMVLASQNYDAYKEYFQSQREIIRSKGIADQVFKELKLGILPEYAVSIAVPSTSSRSSGIKDFINNFTGGITDVSSSETKTYPDQADPVDQLRQTIKVEEVRNTRLLKLHVENKDPVLAADIANRITQIYVERNLAYISKSEILNLHKNEFLKLQAMLSEYSKIFKEHHPKILRLKEKMEEVKKNIKQEIDENLPGHQPEISTSDLTGLKANNISVQEWAKPVFKPIRPNKSKNILMSIIFGVLGGSGLAFFMEYLDQSIKSSEDIQRLVNWPFLGYIPKLRQRKKNLDFYIHLKPRSAFAEVYRSIRTGLLFSSTQEHPLKSILLTSPARQEGKTTTISNLAIAMAQNQKKVLLVDADMRRPRMHHVYKTNNKMGLSTYLSGQTPFEKIVCNTMIENLSLVGCGPQPPNPSELLASRNMNEFMTHAKKQFDFILFDTPPIMVVTDAVILSKIVDGTVIILESGRTSRKVIPMMRETLENSKSRVIGFLINKVKVKIGELKYYYKY